MSVARVTEITASSTTSFEDALQAGVDRAVEDPEERRGRLGAGAEGDGRDGQVAEYRVNMKVTFVLED